ncbi:MAG: acetyl-CoA carboxylase biotin carboxyl carrier protein [Chitinophagales bacterium]|jgi:acetyl-CoA carboxylase biotin carboxyl carrier protein|nr:acetyl-CoA carboxylase biotin carboxyl carrier protein [Chitinophagales bacterium]
MDLKEIQELIKLLNKSNISEIRIERDNFKIMLRTHDANGPIQFSRQDSAQPMSTNAMPQAQQPEVPSVSKAVDSNAIPPSDNDKYLTIKSPMIGTFYRSSSPDKPSFVNVGDEIQPGSILCIIEAMKLFNEIESEQAGRIVKILIENAKPVEYDQPLFLIEPL